jgi:hypothetical protein
MMNERIRALAEQAGIDFFNSTDAEFVGKEYCEAWIEQQQKFAELIVRECSRIGELKEQGYSDYDPDVSVGWYMRQHFGVE